MTRTMEKARTGSEEPEWIVWVVVALGLLLGWLLQSSVVNRTKTVTVGQASLAYPASWMPASEKDAAFAAGDLLGGGAYGPRVRVYEVPKARLLSGSDAAIGDAASRWAIERGRGRTVYRVLGISPARVGGKDAVSVETAYLAEPPAGSPANAVPSMMRAVDTLALAGDTVYVLSFAAENHRFDDFREQREKLLKSWRLP